MTRVAMRGLATRLWRNYASLNWLPASRTVGGPKALATPRAGPPSHCLLLPTAPVLTWHATKVGPVSSLPPALQRAVMGAASAPPTRGAAAAG